MDCRYWPGPATIWYSFPSANKSNPDLPSHRQFASSATLARAHQDRKYCEVSGHRGGRCPGDSGTSGCLIDLQGEHTDPGTKDVPPWQSGHCITMSANDRTC